MTDLTLAGVVRRHAAERPDHPYLHVDDETISYADLDERTNRVAAALVAAGVQAGDRVALLDKNGPECLDVMFGAAKCGAVYVPVSWRLAAPEVAGVLRDAEPAILFVGTEFVPGVSDVVGSLDSVRTLVEIGGSTVQDPRYVPYRDWAAASDPKDPGVQADPDDLAVLMYTSGTTGTPKGAMLTQRSLLGGVPGLGEMCSYDSASVNLVAMPLFHIGGTGITLVGIVPGATSVLIRDFDPQRALELISKHRVTNTLLVPAMIAFMLDSPACAAVDWSTMRALVYGASPISDAVLHRAMEVMRCDFLQIYGMTEHSGVVSLLPAAAHSRPKLLRSCGLPLPWVEVQVVDPSTGAPAAPGEVGEFLARSDQVMRGYWRQPDATADAITADGWYRTGDAGYRDDKGYLFISDRVKDMIISGGENVYPAEIENVLMGHPAVADAAVIGVPHDRWGETPRAVLVKRADHAVTPDDIVAFCRERLAGFKCPTSVEFVDALPRNPSGKILKFELREPFWRGRDRRVG